MNIDTRTLIHKLAEETGIDKATLRLVLRARSRIRKDDQASALSAALCKRGIHVTKDELKRNCGVLQNPQFRRLVDAVKAPTLFRHIRLSMDSAAAEADMLQPTPCVRWKQSAAPDLSYQVRESAVPAADSSIRSDLPETGKARSASDRTAPKCWTRRLAPSSFQVPRRKRSLPVG